jgi:hypothetical protein
VDQLPAPTFFLLTEGLEELEKDPEREKQNA